MDAPFSLDAVPVLLGEGAHATPLVGFSWDPEYLAGLDERAGSGEEARLVTWFAMDAAWTSWERHPAGEEVVLSASGRVRVIQELDGAEVATELGPGEYLVNPPGVWHTADVLEPAHGLFITPGRGTEHRPR